MTILGTDDEACEEIFYWAQGKELDLIYFDFSF